MNRDGNHTHGGEADTSPPDRQARGMRVKTYVVMQRSFRRDRHNPNTKIIAVRLTQSEAQEIVDQIPGTWWERHFATKRPR